MRRVVLLDAGPLGMVSNPKGSPENQRCKDWMNDLRRKGVEVRVPEIADYEVRRELLRAGATRGIERLDDVIDTVGYIPLTTEAVRKAAELWAEARKQGVQTASDKAL